MSQNPVCHLPTPTVAVTHDPVPLPNVPVARPDLISLTATVNALRQTVMILSGQVQQAGPQGAPGRPGQPGGGVSGSKPEPSGSWEQLDIQTEVVRVYNPKDKEQYVDVQRVNSLTMRNKATKQLWKFTRPPNNDGT